MAHSGGNRTHRPRSRVGVITSGVVAAVLALAVSACGGGSSSNSEEQDGTYRAKVVKAEFPAKQRLGETTLMRIGVRNDGDRTMPTLVISVTVGGKEGEASSLPFAIRDPQPGLAQPERPVWVLAEHYPKLAGSEAPGGAETANSKVFEFGPLKPGKTIEAVWKLSAVRTGKYSIHYKVDAGYGGEAKAETAEGVQPGGSFAAEITEKVPDMTVTDSGEVVEIGKGRKKQR